jgi:hypothetical protein
LLDGDAALALIVCREASKLTALATLSVQEHPVGARERVTLRHSGLVFGGARRERVSATLYGSPVGQEPRGGRSVDHHGVAFPSVSSLKRRAS